MYRRTAFQSIMSGDAGHIVLRFVHMLRCFFRNMFGLGASFEPTSGAANNCKLEMLIANLLNVCE